MKHLILILMVVAVALSSCTSAKTTDSKQFPLTTETQEIILPEEPVKETAETVTEEIAESIPDSNVEVVAKPIVETVVQPIIRNYSIDGQDLSLTAYPGRAYLAYPKAWSMEKIKRIASYLVQRYPEETKTISYKEDGGIIFLYYPETWTENELSYAELLLVQEIENITAMENSLVTSVVEPVVEEAVVSEKIVVEEPAMDVEVPATEQPATETGEASETSLESSVDNWWEDPIFMQLEENQENVYEVAEDATEEPTTLEETIPFVEPSIIETPVVQETDHSNMFEQLKSVIIIAVILLALFVVVLSLKRKTNKKK